MWHARPALDIEGLTKQYRKKVVLQSVTLQIRAGEIFALLGNNGAGKTTLIGCVCGLVRPRSGRIRILGTDAAEDPVGARRLLGRAPED